MMIGQANGSKEPDPEMPRTEAGSENEAREKTRKKQQIEILLLIILVPVLIYLLMTTLFKSPKKASVVKPPVALQEIVAKNSADAEKVAAKISKGENAAKQQGALDAEWGDNPFSARTSKTAPSEGGSLALQGIVLEGGGRSYAVINEKIVAVGDHVAEYAVKEIRKDRVVIVDKDGKEFVLES